MSNISYCRFENTLNDLRDCCENMYEECSKSEDENRKLLIDLCHAIAKNYEVEDKLPVEKE